MNQEIIKRDVKREIALQVKNIRQGLQMTQEVLAERAGTKKSNISRFESGRYNPSLEFLEKLAEGLGKQITIQIKERDRLYEER